MVKDPSGPGIQAPALTPAPGNAFQPNYYMLCLLCLQR